LEPLRDSWLGVFTFGLLFAWMILPKDRWITLLKEANFTTLAHEYFHGMGAFLVEKPMLYEVSNTERKEDTEEIRET